MIEQESRYDGFYALCTNLEDPAGTIIRLNGRRWMIENGFRTGRQSDSHQAEDEVHNLTEQEEREGE